jgi:hypothetical protein
MSLSLNTMMAKPEDASIEDLVKQFSTLSSSMEPRQQLDQHRRKFLLIYSILGVSDRGIF